MVGLRKRVAFVIAAGRAGYEWFAGIWRFLAPLVGIAGAVGLIVLADAPWQLLAMVGVAVALLLFIEGAYRLWRESLPVPTPEVLPRLEELHHEGRYLKGNLTAAYRNSTPGGFPQGAAHVDYWTSQVVSELEPIRPGDAYRIEQEDAAHIATVYDRTSPDQSRVINLLTARLSRLGDVIAELKGGGGGK